MPLLDFVVGVITWFVGLVGIAGLAGSFYLQVTDAR